MPITELLESQRSRNEMLHLVAELKTKRAKATAQIEAALAWEF
jgi:hypothetical protein